MTIVWTTEIPATEKLVLLALADNANDEGDCYPSISTISRKCSLSERAIHYAMNRLAVMGHISKNQRPGRSTLYSVHPCTKCTPAPNAPLHQMQTPLHQMHPTPAPSADHPCTPCTHNHQVTIKGTVNEPPVGLNRAVWDRWQDYRRSVKRPLKQASIPAAQKKLAAFGDDQSAVVEQSIANGWQGLFPVKSGANNNNDAQTRKAMP